MGLFDKKYCDICGEKLSLLGNKKLVDGSICKNCEALLSPHFTDRKKASLSDIKDQLAYREENKKNVAKFNVTRIIGRSTKVIFDEDSRKFMVTSAEDWELKNPDVIDFSEVTECDTKIRENKTELKFKDNDGKEVSFSPKQYNIDYDFFVTIQLNSPWFNFMYFSINDRSVDTLYSSEYRDMEQGLKDIKRILTQPRIKVLVAAGSSSETKEGQKCSYCGAISENNSSKFCEFCGGEF